LHAFRSRLVQHPSDPLDRVYKAGRNSATVSNRIPRGVELRTNVAVSPYEDRYRDQCRQLWAELTQKHRDIYRDQGIGGPEPGLFFDEHLEKAGRDRILLAFIGDEVVGMLGYLQTEEEIEVEPLVVSQNHRGEGVGTALMSAFMERVRDSDAKYLNVRPVARNKEALEFFRKKGFDKVGRVELFMDRTGKKWEKGVRLHDADYQC
jgi:GNAT superfamily N-acetyltransferase